MSILDDSILVDPIEVLFEVRVEPLGTFGDEYARRMQDAIIKSAEGSPEWFADRVYNMTATNNNEFVCWLHNIIERIIPYGDVDINEYVAFWYGVPEVPDRRLSIMMKTAGYGQYRLKIWDKKFEQQYRGINPYLYDAFLQSYPSGTNSYDRLNTILNS